MNIEIRKINEQKHLADLLFSSALQWLGGVSKNQSIIAECGSSKAANIGQELAPLGLKFVHYSPHNCKEYFMCLGL